jgi:AbiTii-like protein
MIGRRHKDLLTKIEESALSSDRSLADALRLCVALGGQVGSSDLRDWASRELRGYDGDAELPDYRRVMAPILANSVHGNQFIGGTIITGERISPGELPDLVSDQIGEEVELHFSVAELDRLGRRDDSVKLSPPMGADIVRMMNYERQGSLAHINDVYWSVAPSSLEAVVDQIRTRLVELVAEIRAGVDDETELFSAELADQAVSIVIRGDGNRVVTNNTRVAHGDNLSSSGSGEESPSTAWVVFVAMVGLATIAGAIFAGFELLG